MRRFKLPSIVAALVDGDNVVIAGALTLGAATTCVILSGRTAVVLARPIWAGMLLNTSAALIGTGLFICRRQPASTFAAILIALGFVNFGLALEGAPDPLLNFAGIVYETIFMVGFAYLALSFPGGRLGRLRLATFLFTASTLVVGRALLVLLGGDVRSYSPIGNEAAGPSAHAPNIGGDLLPGWLVSSIQLNGRLAILVLAIVPVIAVLVRTGLRHRSRVWIALLIAVTLALCIGLQMTVLVGDTGLLSLALFAGSLVLPWIFLIAFLAGWAGALGPIARVLTWAGGASDLATLEESLRRALRDSRLRLATIDSEKGQILDTSGAPVTSFGVEGGRRWTYVGKGERLFALMIHNGAIAEDVTVGQAETDALRLAVTRSLLAAEAERAADDVSRTQEGLLAASKTTHRTLELNLQSGAEQRLAQVRGALASARKRARGRTTEALTAVDMMLEGLEEDLEDLTRGMEPRLLEEGGLAAVLREVAESMPGKIRLDGMTERRYAPEVESAVYFCSMEAIQNAVKHGGPDVHVLVAVWESGNQLNFEVRDSGRGFDLQTVRRGTGLDGMVDRLARAGGSMTVTSSPSGGTVVSGRVEATAAGGHGRDGGGEEPKKPAEE